MHLLFKEVYNVILLDTHVKKRLAHESKYFSLKGLCAVERRKDGFISQCTILPRCSILFFICSASTYEQRDKYDGYYT